MVANDDVAISTYIYIYMTPFSIIFNNRMHLDESASTASTEIGLFDLCVEVKHTSHATRVHHDPPVMKLFRTYNLGVGYVENTGGLEDNYRHIGL